MCISLRIKIGNYFLANEEVFVMVSILCTFKSPNQRLMTSITSLVI